MKIAIGIHVHAQPERLQQTLEVLFANTGRPFGLLLLPDGPDAPTRALLAGLRDIPQLGTVEPRGAPACFNRLAAAGDADVLVLLESGALVGPGWLDHLLAALAADERNGLAGPSTNRAWNEQAALPSAMATPADLARAAAEVARRFGAMARTLEPLYSLADFCYAVRREVVEAIGGADEGYGLGPCWEMDYNIRAARAGWRGVWAGAAYVARAPFTPRRRYEEARRFEASRRRYQDTFCALRLRGERPGYEPHCRGDACEHFAPADLIRIHRPLPTTDHRPTTNDQRPTTDDQRTGTIYRAPTTTTTTNDHPTTDQRTGTIYRAPTTTTTTDGRSTTEQRTGSIYPAPTTTDDRSGYGHDISCPNDQPFAAAQDAQPTDDRQPMVSCIMPTRDRATFALRAVEYFLRQDYPSRELIIVDNGSDDLAGRLPSDGRVRCIRVPPGTSIGEKRNRACAVARGAIIAQWDDDDWYAVGRLSAQVAPLLCGEAEISALTTGAFLDLPRWEFWRVSPELHRRLFVEDVHGGTLVYRREVWEQYVRYPNRSLAEDALFLRQALNRGARLRSIPGDELFVYLRHSANSWLFACGQYLDPRGWQRIAEPAFLAADRAFYARVSGREPEVGGQKPAGRDLAAGPESERQQPAAGNLQSRIDDSRPARPLVSCIMPTYNRRAFVPLALEYFLRQDYEPRELIVVDDGEEAVGDLLPDDPRVYYLRLERRASVGEKRNRACAVARGALIAHWDDDDWHAPHRLSRQVEALVSAGADLCGISTLLFYAPVAGRAWRYVYPPGQRPWLAGSSLCYRRKLWAHNNFASIDVGEDTRFVWSDHRGRMLALPDATFHIGMVHDRNVSPKQTRGPYWHPIPADEIRRLLGADWPRYERFGALG